MFKKHSFQVKLVKDSTDPVTPENHNFVLDLTQLTTDENRRAFVVLFGAYASVKLLNTACKIALIAASK